MAWRGASIFTSGCVRWKLCAPLGFVHHRSGTDHGPGRNGRGLERRERDAEVEVPQILSPLRACVEIKFRLRRHRRNHVINGIDFHSSAPPKHLSTQELPGRNMSAGAPPVVNKTGDGLASATALIVVRTASCRLGAHCQSDGVEGVARQRDRHLVPETPARGDVHLRELFAVPRDFRSVADENRDVVAVPQGGVDDRLAQISRRRYDKNLHLSTESTP